MLVADEQMMCRWAGCADVKMCRRCRDKGAEEVQR